MEEVRPKKNIGLALAAYFLAGIIFTKSQQFSSNVFYTIPLLIVAGAAGWFHYKSRFIKRGLLRWIVLLIASALVLGFVAGIFNHFS